MHQGGFVATRQQLLVAGARGCLHDHYVYHWSYHEIETADTELYFRCKFMKVIPISAADATLAASLENGGQRQARKQMEHGHGVLQNFLVHHMPNKYVKEGTIMDKFFMTDDMLIRWLDECEAT